jgi:hypothetical protein
MFPLSRLIISKTVERKLMIYNLWLIRSRYYKHIKKIIAKIIHNATSPPIHPLLFCAPFMDKIKIK